MNYRILATAAAAILIGGGLYYYGLPERTEPVDKKIDRPAPQESGGVGIIDIERIQAAHPDGETLNQLRATELRLRLELNEAMKVVELPKPAPPETDSEVFDEATWQKNAQRVMSQLAELKSRKKLLAEEYRKNSEPRYIEERNKIRDKFMNEQFNIQLKLKNSDHLRLPQEEYNELLERLDQIEIERNRLQSELFERWNAEIAQYAEDSVAEDEARLRAESDRLRAEVEEQSRKKESDVTARNKKLMDDALREMESRQNRRRELWRNCRRSAMNVRNLNSGYLIRLRTRRRCLRRRIGWKCFSSSVRPRPKKNFHCGATCGVSTSSRPNASVR